MLSSGTALKVIGQREIEAKLLAAAPRIREHNKLMMKAMFGEIQPIVVAATPVGPGHFGFHARERIHVQVTSRSWTVVGQLLGPRQLLWRERGTRRGERAFRTAHKAAAGVRRFIRFYYNGMANWWRV